MNNDAETQELLMLPWPSRRKLLAREALRYLPLIVRLDAADKGLLRLHALRVAITLATSSTIGNLETFSAYRSLWVRIYQTRLNEARGDDLLTVDWTLARSSTRSLLSALDATEHSDKDVIRDAIDPYSFGSPKMEECKILGEVRGKDLFTLPLWLSASSLRFGGFEFTVSSINQDYFTSVSGFWRDWYQGFLDGNPLDWELQRRVALIDDAIWEAGPEAVAEEIERIRAAYEVERRAAELEASAQAALQTTRGIGDNNPPSPIEEALATSDGLTIIWAAAQELKEEAQSEAPDKTRVEKAISAIVGVLKASGLWAAKKVDKGLNAAVIAAGTAGGGASVVWITQNSGSLMEFVKAAEAWLPFLP